MGGINHAPCKHHLKNSTSLSRSISLAHASVETANVFFEDLILEELNDGKPRKPHKVIEEFKASLTHIKSALNYCGALRTQMHKLKYEDLAAKKRMNLPELGKRLAGEGVVNKEAWDVISGLMNNGSFHDVLDRVETNLNAISTQTFSLISEFFKLCDHKSITPLTAVMEENQPGNVKVTFAKLYSSWAKFHQEFLASSMISTEIWYAQMGYGSLLSPNKSTQVA